MKAVIMAGGLGTRIASVRSDVPKPMIEICGKPILQHQIENLLNSGITEITLVTGHLGHKIQEYFGDGSKFGVKISYFNEDHPLGTAGALFKMEGLTEDFLLLCGDTMFNLDFARFIEFHKSHKAWASLMAHPNGHPYDSSLLVTEILPPEKEGELPRDSKRVAKWLAKEDERLYYKNRVNAGIEIISPELLEYTKKNYKPRHPETPDKIDLDRDVLKPAIPTGKIFAYDTPEYIKDMGTPDRYYETEKDLQCGRISAKNLSQKQKAVFLDRDGTLNKDRGFITSSEQLELIDGVAEAVKAINKSGYLAIVITNQPVIARGECSFETLQQIHDKLETELGKDGAYIDALYYCPHHPDSGFEGERIAYKGKCNCRKPATGLIEQAQKDFNIDISQSFMVGDSSRDTDCGKNAGCKANILVDEKYTLSDFVKEYISGDSK